MENPKKPQFDNFDLQVSIIKLNFLEPLRITCHPFIKEILAWNPMPYKYVKPKTATKLIEINNPDQFTEMISTLKAAPIWAVDLEHSCANSYAGITCSIQISTDKENFLIDPFNLHKEIKRFLKPLLESKNHLKVMHGCFNDMRWLQRDFDIFAWPVVDTQIIFRYIRRYINNVELEHIPNIKVISLSDLLREYFPSLTLQNYALEDFSQRPLPQHLKEYAIKDTMYLLPLLRKLKNDFRNNTNCEFPFEDLFMECAVDVGKKALYQGKIYPSANTEMKKFNVDSDNNTFRELHKWRSDLAKVLDVPPNNIINIMNLIDLSNITVPAQIELIRHIAITSNFTNHLVEADLISIKDVIDNGRYEEFSQCRECSHPEFFLPERVFVSQHVREFCADSWLPAPRVQNDPSNSTDTGGLYMRDFLWITNKFPYSKCNLIAVYNFTPKDQTKFIAEIKQCSFRIVQLLKCSICDVTVKNAVVPACKCKNPPICCATCWISRCPICKMPVKAPVKFKAVDKIVNECNTFLVTIQESHCFQRLPAIISILTTCELEVMCDFCFAHLEEPMLLKKPAGIDSVVCCRGCDTLYMESYGKHEVPILSKVYDEVTTLVVGLLNSLLRYCEQYKAPERESEYKNWPTTSNLRVRAIERLKKEGKYNK